MGSFSWLPFTAIGAIGIVRLSFEAPGPWQPVPSGWVLLEGEGIDSWPVNYHDRVSGVCVGFDVAFPNVVRPQPKSDEPTPPGYSGTPFHLNIEPNRSTDGRRTLHVSFFPQGDDSLVLVWNVSVVARDNTQYERARQFLFGPNARPVPRPRDLDLGRLHPRSELQSVDLGRFYAGIREELGATSYAECHLDRFQCVLD